MEFTELTEEQLGEMQFAGGKGRKGNNPYGDLLLAVKDGKKVLVKLEEGRQIRHLRWALSQAAKRSGMKVEIKVLADQSGVVVSLPTETLAPPAEAGEPAPDAPAAGTRSRK